MTLAFAARPHDTHDWPFYSEQSVFRWIANDPRDVAQFLGVDPAVLHVTDIRPTVRSQLRGQKVSLDLGHEWWPTLTALRDALDESRGGTLTVTTRTPGAVGLELTVAWDDERITATISGDLGQRHKTLSRRDAQSSEVQAYWEMLGWRFGGGPALTIRDFAPDTPHATLAYSIIEVLALAELHDESSDLHLHDHGNQQTVRPLQRKPLDSVDHLANLVRVRAVELADVAHLPSTWFRGVLLENADLDGWNLSGAVFERSVLADCDLSGAVLDGTNLRDTNILRTNFDATRATHVDFAFATIADCTFTAAHYEQAILFAAKLSHVEAHDWQIDRLLAAQSSLHECRFENSSINGAEFTSAVIAHTQFARTELQRARFDGSVLNNVQFSDSTLTRASFQPVDERLVDEAMRSHPTGFVDEQAERDARATVIASLQGGSLHNVDFDHSALNDAQFPGAHLTNCVFFGATVNGANFSRTTFSGGERDAVGWDAAHPFWSAGTSSETATRILTTFANEEMRLPHLPRGSGSGLTELEYANFGTAKWNFPGGQEAYLFRPLVRQLLRGDWTPRTFFGLAGHGLNSYAWTYLVVHGDVAVVAQINRGNAYRNAERQAAEWASLMTSIERFLAEVETPEPGEEQLVVVFNSLRSEYGWIVLPAAASAGRVDISAHLRSFDQVSAEEFFDEAVNWPDGPFRGATA